MFVNAGRFRYRITDTLLNAVAKRHLYLLKRCGANRQKSPACLSAGQYNKPNWKTCPDDRVCPYIAAAFRPSTGIHTTAAGPRFHATPIEEFLFHVIARTCVNAGIQRSCRLGKTSDAFRSGAQILLTGKYLLKMSIVSQQEATPRWYISLVKAFRRDCLEQNKASAGKFTFGHAQKIVGLWWKYLWAMGLAVQPPIFPVDSTVLKQHPRAARRVISMLKVTSRDLLDLLKKSGGQSLAAFWECELWNTKVLR